MKEEREAKRKEKEIRLHDTQVGDDEQEEEWDVSIRPLSILMLYMLS